VRGGQNEREAEVITEREPLVAPGACVQIDHPLPRTILPVSPFLEHGPRGIIIGFQRVGALVSKNVNAAPSCRDTLEVGLSSSPTTSGGFKDFYHFYIKCVLISLKRLTIFMILKTAMRCSWHFSFQLKNDNIVVLIFYQANTCNYYVKISTRA